MPWRIAEWVGNARNGWVGVNTLNKKPGKAPLRK